MRPRLAAGVAAVFLAAQAWGLIATWPCFLSYYNLAVGGLRGADRLGLELDYWGESVTRGLLEQVAEIVPEGARVDVAPVLHQFQLEEMLRQSPILRKRGIVLGAHSDDAPRHADYLLIFRRQADLSPTVRAVIESEEPLAAVRREGVLLAGLYKRPG
jgi:hypothetical protein